MMRGLIDEAYKLSEEVTRDGLIKCAGCRAPFTVTMGTFSKTHISRYTSAIRDLRDVLFKQGNERTLTLAQSLGDNEEPGKQKGSYETAWFMAHRIRWAPGQEPTASTLANTHMRGALVDVRTPDRAKARARLENKAAVVSILQRNGDARSKHVTRVTGENLRPKMPWKHLPTS